MTVDFTELFGASATHYGLAQNWDNYSELVLEKVFNKTNDIKFDFVKMENNEGKKFSCELHH